MVPEGWTKSSLVQLCDKISVGLAMSVTPYMSRNGTRLIRNQNIKRGKFNDKSVAYICDEFANKNNSKRVFEGDVVAVRTGSNIGEACVVPKEFNNALTFTTLVARPKKSVLNSDYLCTHINSVVGIAEVQRLMAGGAKPNLNSGEFKNYRILTPPLPEQRKIAKILQTWDRAIATTEKLIDASKRQKKALMQQLLTGKRRFDGFEGEWEELKLEQIADIDSRNLNLETEGNSDFEYISLSDVEPGRIKSPLSRYAFDTAPSRARRIVKKGDILLSTVRPNLQGFAIANEQHDSCVASTGFSVITPKDLTHREYIYHYLFSDHIVTQIDRLVVGSNYPSINSSDVSRLKILWPPHDERYEIGRILTNCDRNIESSQLGLEYLIREKKALMQQLLTGKRRVKVDADEQLENCG